MPILDHVVASGISTYAASAICGGVTTLALTSTNTSQTTAQLLGSGTGYISICSSSGRAVQLPACTIGSSIKIYNAGAATASIYGQTSDNIGGAGANAASALANGKSAEYIKTATNVWGKIL